VLPITLRADMYRPLEAIAVQKRKWRSREHGCDARTPAQMVVVSQPWPRRDERHLALRDGPQRGPASTPAAFAHRSRRSGSRPLAAVGHAEQRRRGTAQTYTYLGSAALTSVLVVGVLPNVDWRPRWT
jgi:hypothetical protein